MPRRRSRFIENRRARRGGDEGFDPQAMMKLAGFGAILLLFIAVGAGFQGERVTSWFAAMGGRLGPLAEPVLFGASLIELGAVVVIVVVFGLAVWRGFRR
ncbi:MAG: hypothetical protein ACOC05_11815 [Oceanicaulis sp.]